jgi:two-component system response regulator HydG
MQRILIIDDNLDLGTLLSRFLTGKGYQVETAASASAGIARFRERPFDVVLCDYRLGKQDGREVLQAVKAIRADTVVVIMTAYGDIRSAVELIKLGAYDYITKPLVPDELLVIIGNASPAGPAPLFPAAPAAGRPERPDTLLPEDYALSRSPAAREVYRQMALVAPIDYIVLIYGESGTGKEVVARTIHRLSPREARPFVAVDCGTLSKELAGSELFGHVKGAFTGALADKAGQFELADGGTLFLDEIANLPLDVQASLLRVIQERKFKRVGSTREVRLDIRILAASNEDLLEACRQGKFREDLYHRLNEFALTLPPLRERREDIPLFARLFLDQVSRELHKNILPFDEEVLQLFGQYAWPGNLRELRNVIRRAALLTPTSAIGRQSLPGEIAHPGLGAALPSMGMGTGTAAPVDPEFGLKGASSSAEYAAILQVLKKVNYNKTKAAALLRIDRKTLYNKLRNKPDG